MDCIQRKIVVRPCPTTIFSYSEGFFDDHFAVILKPFSGEGGIRTRETLLAFTHFPGVPLQPLEHLSLFASEGCTYWKAPQRYNNICTLPNCLPRRKQAAVCGHRLAGGWDAGLSGEDARWS